MTQFNFELRNSLCPHVCSSDDFEVERKFLAKSTFPKIAEYCQQRGAGFHPFDILWSQSDEHFQNGELLNILLENAKNSSPFLICLLGERYGPYRPEKSSLIPSKVLKIPETCLPLEKNYIVAAINGHSWILEPANQNLSFLELEIIQSAFLRDSEHCHFYFRQSEHLEEKLAHVNESEHDQFKNSFLAENENSGLKVTDLKQRIVKKGLTVKYFKCLEELGSIVFEDWKTVIDMIYPPLYHNGQYLETEEYREWVCQNCFELNRLESYVGSDTADNIMNQLTTFAVKRNLEAGTELNRQSKYQRMSKNNFHLGRKPQVVQDSIMVLSGDRGVGKSTLISKWLEKFKQEEPQVHVIHHFVGCSQKSTDVAVILHKIIQQIKDKLIVNNEEESVVEVDQTKSFQELTESFLASVSSLHCVVVIDGLDELGASLGQTPQEVKDFCWLPSKLPPQCKIIVSTSRSDLTFDSLTKRQDVKIINIKSLLEDQQKTLILMENMKHFYQRLTKHNLKQIADIKLSKKPLFLRLLASELCCYDVYADLNEYLDDHYELCSVREFWIKSLKRWVAEYSWRLDSINDDGVLSEEDLETTGWVPDVLRLLVLSQNGLTQNEILLLLIQLGYKRQKQVTRLDWLKLKQCLGNNLREESTGLIKFSHQHLSEVADYTLFKSVKQAAGEIKPTEDMNQRRIFHQHLAIFFLKQPFTHRQLEELPWQLLMAGNLDNLIDLLTNEKYLPHLLDVYMKNPTDRINLIYYWSILMKNGYNPVFVYKQYLSSIGLTNLHVDTQSATNSPRSELEHDNHKENADRIVTAMDENYENTDSDNKMESTNNGISRPSFIYEDNDDNDKDETSKTMLPLPEIVSLSWYISQLLLELGYQHTTLQVLIVLAEFLHKNRPFGLFEQLIFTRSLDCVGNLYLINKQYKNSYIYYKKSLRALLELEDSDDEQLYTPEINTLKGSILSQLGKIKMVDGNLYEAEDLYKEALECFNTSPYHKVMKSNIEYNLGILRLEQGDFNEAEICLEESLSIREQQYGQNNILISENLIALARLLSNPMNYQGYDRQEAEYLYRRALVIREKSLGKDAVLISEVLQELGKLLSEEPNYQAKTEAANLFSRALDIKTQQLGGNHEDIKVLQSLLTNMKVSIKLGHYQFGLAKPTDHRSKHYPYSPLSFRENVLKEMTQKDKHRQNRMTRSYSSESFSRNASPISALHQISASEKILLESESPLLAKREVRTNVVSSKLPSKSVDLSSPVSNLTTLARRQQNTELNLDAVLEKDVKHGKDSDSGSSQNENVIDNYAFRVTSPPPSSPQTPVVTISVKKRPTSAPNSLFYKYNAANRFFNSHSGLRKMTPISSALSTKSLSLPHRPKSGRSFHSEKCHVPGPHAINLSTTRSVTGPNSSIQSLLGPPEVPRDVHRQIHHSSAWYHVPGRYAVPKKEYPPKRSQSRPGSALTFVSLSESASKHHRSHSAQEILYDVDEEGEIIPLPVTFKIHSHPSLVV